VAVAAAHPWYAAGTRVWFDRGRHRPESGPGRALAVFVAATVAFPFVGLTLFPNDRGAFTWILVATTTAFVLGTPALLAVVAWSVLREVRAARAVAAELAAAAGWPAVTEGRAPTYVGRHRDRPVALRATIAFAPHRDDARRRRSGAHPVLRFTVGEGADAVSFDLPPTPLPLPLLTRVLDAAIAEA
jgi:hypothetical protein